MVIVDPRAFVVKSVILFLCVTKAIAHVEGTDMVELKQQIEANMDGPRDTNTQEESSTDDEQDHDPR